MGPASHSRTTSAGPKNYQSQAGIPRSIPINAPLRDLFLGRMLHPSSARSKRLSCRHIGGPFRQIQRSTVDPGADLVGLPDGLRSSALHLSCVSLVHDSTDWPLLKDLAAARACLKNLRCLSGPLKNLHGLSCKDYHQSGFHRRVEGQEANDFNELGCALFPERYLLMKPPVLPAGGSDDQVSDGRSPG
jgi:hypothetical protein